jgi:hypothetical protein
MFSFTTKKRKMKTGNSPPGLEGLLIFLMKKMKPTAMRQTQTTLE